MSACYDHKPERMTPIQIAGELVLEYGDHPLCCQAAAAIRDLLVELRASNNALEEAEKARRELLHELRRTVS